jgi:hypothetical protein
MAARTNAETQEERTLMERLQAMPKKTIHIPEDEQNPGDVVPIGWNGIIYAVPRGREFEVPEVIADIWKNAYEQTQKAKRKITISELKDIVVSY